jgi:hypothetical protein
VIILSSLLYISLLAARGSAQTWISHDDDQPAQAAPQQGITSATEPATDPATEQPPDLPPMSDLPPLPLDQTQAAASSEPAKAEEPKVLPDYLALESNLNDFVAFSDGGWDGNWYVGYNSCWIVKLPPATAGSFVRAFIGAKLGRAKMTSKPGNAFEQFPIPGKIYMALSPNPAFSTEQSYFLTATDDIPAQPDPNLISSRIGDPGWFWTEVPVEAISTQGPNYLAIWSNTEGFVSVSSSPILAAAKTEQPADAWLNRSIHGVPPRDPAAALETRLSRLLPALAIKLVPANHNAVKVGGLRLDRSADGETVLRFSAEGSNIEETWYEVSYDMLSWMREGPLLRHPPFAFTLSPRLSSAREAFVRVVAVDSLGNQGQSAPSRLGKPAP